MPELVSAAVASSITIFNGTFSLLQTFSRLAEVDEDLKICLKLLAIAERDLNYARRQLRSCGSNQSHQITSIDFQHLESAIGDTEAATLSLGELIEAYRVQRDVDKIISPVYRFKWVVQGKDRFASRQGVLNMAHISLLAASQKMDTAALAAPQSATPPPYSPGALAGNSKILRSPSQQRTLRGKSSRILPSLEAEAPQVPVPSTPSSQGGASSPTQSRRVAPTAPRLRRMPRTVNGERMGAVVEEERLGNTIYG